MSPGAWLAVVWWSMPMPAPIPSSWWAVEWEGFPASALEATIRDVPATFHGRDDWRAATFLEVHDARDPLPTPRFVFDAGTYRPETVVDDLPLDAAEGLISAALEGALAVDPEREAEVGRRARELVGDWPPDVGEAALRVALAELGGHALSLALETRRSAARLADRGVDVCELALDERLIFSLWSRSLDPASHLLRRGPAFGPPLRAEDRDWLLGRVLGLEWSGEPARDLDLGCGGPSVPDGGAER